MILLHGDDHDCGGVDGLPLGDDGHRSRSIVVQFLSVLPVGEGGAYLPCSRSGAVFHMIEASDVEFRFPV